MKHRWQNYSSQICRFLLILYTGRKEEPRPVAFTPKGDAQ